mmetsp:Transcript_9216/g.33793  ORF Transcript_9216/g.33793 Transcript_9216/m.33793 type:complete len:243 (+) Transcript_9216:986-1714(+)
MLSGGGGPRYRCQPPLQAVPAHDQGMVLLRGAPAWRAPRPAEHLRRGDTTAGGVPQVRRGAEDAPAGHAQVPPRLLPLRLGGSVRQARGHGRRQRRYGRRRQLYSTELRRLCVTFAFLLIRFDSDGRILLLSSRSDWQLHGAVLALRGRDWGEVRRRTQLSSAKHERGGPTAAHEQRGTQRVPRQPLPYPARFRPRRIASGRRARRAVFQGGRRSSRGRALRQHPTSLRRRALQRRDVRLCG